MVKVNGRVNYRHRLLGWLCFVSGLRFDSQHSKRRIDSDNRNTSLLTIRYPRHPQTRFGACRPLGDLHASHAPASLQNFRYCLPCTGPQLRTTAIVVVRRKLGGVLGLSVGSWKFASEGHT